MGTITVIFILLLQSNTFSGANVGHNIITVSKIASTNEYLKDELSKSTPLHEGTVIMAVQQTAGKGQRGASWESEPGKNLTCSVLLYPTFLDPRQQFILTIAISVAVARALEALTLEPVRIKWPNDIFVGDRKVAGILIENQLQGQRWKSAIVGLGLNVNQEVFSENIAARATSLRIVTGQSHDLHKTLSTLCHYIGKAYAELRAGLSERLRRQYDARLFARGELREFLLEGGTRIRGKIVGVSELGELLVEFKGHRSSFGIKEIAYTF